MIEQRSAVIRPTKVGRRLNPLVKNPARINKESTMKEDVPTLICRYLLAKRLMTSVPPLEPPPARVSPIPEPIRRPPKTLDTK